MSDLIKREDAIEAIEELPNAYNGWSDAYDKAYIIGALEEVPSADRPQGGWIEQEDCWQCSECGDEYVLEVGVKPIDARMHYCPNCGARMLAKDTNVPNKERSRR